MIDENRLSELVIGDVGNSERSWAIESLTEEEAVELIRLARLGLWAEKHGIKALRDLHSLTKDKRYNCSSGWVAWVSGDALTALPKERHE